MFQTIIECDEKTDDGGAVYDGPAKCRIVNPDAEDGRPVAGGASWVNSASVEIDPDDDSVTFGVSIDDPRGEMTFTVRRLNDGRVVVFLPTPSDPQYHVKVAVLHRDDDGATRSLVVVGDRGAPRDFSDDTSSDD